MLKRLKSFLKLSVVTLIIAMSQASLISCTSLKLPSQSYKESLQLTQSQTVFGVRAKSMNGKGLLADGPETQRITLNILKKVIDKDAALSSDNLKWGQINIQLPAYYGPMVFLSIREQQDLSQFKQSLAKFNTWAALPYGERVNNKEAMNAYLKTYGMGASERQRYALENSWYVINDEETQEPLLILHKDYQRSTLPSNTIGFRPQDLEVLLQKVETTFDTFEGLNNQQN